MIHSNPDVNESSTSNPTLRVEEALTPAVRNILGNLALMAEGHVELSRALGEASSTMASLIDRHPELDRCSSELRAKIAQLQNLSGELGKEVMRYSLSFEDAVTGPPGGQL